jgi:hypothetical protein
MASDESKPQVPGNPVLTPKSFAELHQPDQNLLSLFTGYTNPKNVKPSETSPSFLFFISNEPRSFPNIVERQEVLTKITLNAALQVVLETYLKERKSFETIKQIGLLKPSVTWPDFCKAVDIKPSQSIGDAIKKWKGPILLSNRLKEKGMIATSTDLLNQIDVKDVKLYPYTISEVHIVNHETGEERAIAPTDAIEVHPALRNFFNAAAEYEFQRDKDKHAKMEYVRLSQRYEHDIRAWNARGEKIEKFKQREPVPPTPPPRFKHERPIDPRVERFNALFGETITIYETGHKSWETASSKLAKKSDPCVHHSVKLNASDLRDGNRITLIPNDFKLSSRLIEIIGHRSNTLIQEPKLMKTGHFDQKAYTDIRIVRDGVLSEVKGPVAEIKVETKAIHSADKRTHPIYELMRKMEYFEPKEDEEEVFPNREEVSSMMREYNEIVARYSQGSRFVKFQPRNYSGDFECWENMARGPYQDLIMLSKSIYAHAMKKAPDEIKIAYMVSALQLNYDSGGREIFPQYLLEKIDPDLFKEVSSRFVPRAEQIQRS